MKLILLLTTLLLSGLASANNAAEFLFDGSSLSESQTLNSSVYRTEYRTERVLRTCYRRICTNRPICRRVCDQRRRNCRRVCRSRNICRTQAHSCYHWENVPYQVLDYYTQATVNFSFEANGDNYAEHFRTTLNGESLRLKVKDSGKHLIAVKKDRSENSRSGDTKMINRQLDLKLFDLTSFHKAAQGGVQNLKLKNGLITFGFEEFTSPFDTKINISVTRLRRLASNIVLLKKSFTPDELSNGDGTFSLELADQDVKLGKGRYQIRVEFALDTKNLRVLNKPKTKKAAAKTYKLR